MIESYDINMFYYIEFSHGVLEIIVWRTLKFVSLLLLEKWLYPAAIVAESHSHGSADISMPDFKALI